MTAKQNFYREDARDKIRRGVHAMADANGDMLGMGVIDPAKVTRLALQNAAPIASLVLTIDCMIANAPKKVPAGESLSGAAPEMFRERNAS